MRSSGRGEDLETLTIIANGAPYGTEQVWSALRLATASISSSVGMEVNIFLLGDAVSAAKRGQKPPKGYYNLEAMLRDLIEKGAKVAACGTCLSARFLSREDIVEGIEIGTMTKLARWVRESSKALSF